MDDLLIGSIDVGFQGFEVIFVHDFLLSESIDFFLKFFNIAHGFIVPFIILY